MSKDPIWHMSNPSPDHSVHSGMLTELTYTICLKRSNLIQEFISELKKLNGNNKVTLIAGYNTTSC